MLPPFPLCWVFFIINGCYIWSNAFSASIDMIMWFLSFFLFVMYYVYWFANIVPSLHPWDESHLIMVYDLFNVLLDAVCQYFVENLASMFIRYIGLKFSFFVVSLSGFGIRWCWLHKKSLGVFHHFGIFPVVLEG